MRLFLLIPMFVLCMNLQAHAQIFDQTTVGDFPGFCPGAGHDNTDNQGNTYSIVYEGSNPESIYITKKDASGNLLWKTLTGAANYATINIDSYGNVYLLAAAEQISSKPLVAKYNSSGTLIWETISTYHQDFPGTVSLYSIKIDSEGSVIIGGTATGEYIFGDFHIPTAFPEREDLSGIFVAKFNMDGEVQWAKITHTFENAYTEPFLNSLELDAQDNIYICGDLDQPTYFAGVSMIPPGREGAFIVKLNPSGNLVWANQIGADEIDAADICIGENNIVQVTASFSFWNSSSFATLGQYTIPNPNQTEDYFLTTIYGRINQQLVPQKLYRINAGGPEIPDNELNWQQDRQSMPSLFLDPSSSNHTTGTFDTWDGINTTGAPKDIFGPNRYQIFWGAPLAYKLPVVSGLYQVNLYFAEKPAPPGVALTGHRIFDIEIEGAVRLKDLDIYSKAGLNALKESFLVSSDELLEIKLLKKMGDPQVNGLEVISLITGTQNPVLSTSAGTFSSDQNKGVSVSENHGIIYVKLDEKLNEPFDLLIYNSSGQVYFEKQYSSADAMLEIPALNLAPGLYILKIAEKTLKFVKQ